MILYRFTTVLQSFGGEENGATLAEYLVLMGVLTVAITGGVLFFGTQLSTAFAQWGSWISDNAGPV